MTGFSSNGNVTAALCFVTAPTIMVDVSTGVADGT